MTQAQRHPLVAVGIDGSEGGRRALAWAADYVSAVGGSLVLVSVCTERVVYGLPPLTAIYDPDVDAQEDLDKALADLTLPRERVSTRVTHGKIGPALLKGADAADLLVVGARGRSAVASTLLGSVSTHCVHHSPVPVVVVR